MYYITVNARVELNKPTYGHSLLTWSFNSEDIYSVLITVIKKDFLRVCNHVERKNSIIYINEILIKTAFKAFLPKVLMDLIINK